VLCEAEEMDSKLGLRIGWRSSLGWLAWVLFTPKCKTENLGLGGRGGMVLQPLSQSLPPQAPPGTGKNLGPTLKR
jgi:hypothetical protein